MGGGEGNNQANPLRPSGSTTGSKLYEPREQSDLVPYCLLYRLHQISTAEDKAGAFVEISGKGSKCKD